MIPKKIHYCWFGEKPLTDEAKRCIDSWRNLCPDYEIIRWDENNFDVLENNYCREAYEEKKWAFVSDYARLKILYENGGIYMDTDVEVIKKYDSLLFNNIFCCFEDDYNVSIGTIGAEKGNELIKKLINNYNLRRFRSMKDGSLDLTTNLKIVTDLLVNDYGLLLNGNFQKLRNGIYIYPRDYFIAKNYKTDEYCISKNTFAIHHYSGSWFTDEEKKSLYVYKKYYNFFCWISIETIRSKLAAFMTTLKLKGLKGVIKRIFHCLKTELGD